MDLSKQEQIELLASALKNLQNTLFLEKIQIEYLNLQKLTMPHISDALKMSKLKVSVMEPQIKFYQSKLKELEDENRDDTTSGQ